MRKREVYSISWTLRKGRYIYPIYLWNCEGEEIARPGSAQFRCCDYNDCILVAIQMIQGQLGTMGIEIVDEAIVANPIHIKMKIWYSSLTNSIYFDYIFIMAL